MKRGPYKNIKKLSPPNPSGLCGCGCLGVTAVATMSNASRGNIAGEHVRYIPGHTMLGRRVTQKRVQHIAPPNPSGVCQCGTCGLLTKRARQSNVDRGHVKGEHISMIHNHHRKIAVRYIVEDRGYKTPCWIWQLATDKNGYGHLAVDGRLRKAHRVYYEKFKGSIPPGHEVDHLCHVRPCVNPDHHEAVMPIVNQRRKKNTKLTLEKAREIRASILKPPQLAIAFGVCATTIHKILNKKTWVDED